MASYKKVRGDNNQVNDIGSPHNNFIQVFGDGSGKIVTIFCLALVAGILIYLWIMVHVLLVVMIIGFAVFAFIIGGSMTWRNVSNTRRQHKVNEAEIEWSKIVYTTENLIAIRNRATQEIRIENAQEVQMVMHHSPVQISEQAQSKSSYMPKLSDLSRNPEA